MKAELIRHAIKVKNSPVHGLGVFAEKNIHIGQVVEECMALTLNCECASEADLYTFDIDGKSALLTGSGCIFNHSENPNTDYSYKDNYFIFTAIRFIRKGEELFITYGEEYFSSRKIEVIEVPQKIKIFRHLFSWAFRVAIIIGGYFLLLKFLNNEHLMNLLRHFLNS
jgi:SET domain-containing protein